jgi:nitroreductase
MRSRRMVRDYRPDPVDPALLERLVDLAARAPSAGKVQGWHLVALRGADTARFWDVTLPAERRAGFAWPGLLGAPVVLLPFADPDAYVARYAEPDKAPTGLGAGREAWPAPYWTIDASFAVMSLLLAAHAEGLGTLFFAVPRGTAELRESLGVPSRLELLGAIALGWPAAAPRRAGASAARRRRSPDEILRDGRWDVPWGASADPAR